METTEARFLDALKKALGDAAADVPARVLSASSTHYQLLIRWNRTHNLTRITEPEAAAIKHYADSILGGLAIRAALKKDSFLDLGSGAGFPGLLLALLGGRGTLLDASQKRCSFLETARRELSLGDSITVQHGRAEQSDQSGLVVSRATFSKAWLNIALDCVRPNGVIAIWTAGGEPLGHWESAAYSRGWSYERVPISLLAQEERVLFIGRRPTA